MVLKTYLKSIFQTQQELISQYTISRGTFTRSHSQQQ